MEHYSINSGRTNSLHWEDYVVFGCTLAIPAVIGLYHAIKDWKKNSPTEFLVGNRQMGTIPVALSVTVSFLSALTLLGMPAEVYNYNTMFWWLALGMIVAVGGAAHLFLPCLYKLGVTSVYEGGMKTVLWTDSLQTVIIITGLISLLVQGSLAVGGFTKAWEIAKERGRLLFFE
ncbi:sodium-coupled monocarboxylate transporter 2-like [Haliotis rubra]|uniref:sodium-coupled monocarboxylate transporter 2-like n=1 Tax=Haliotis rubra TaxID=36100 RepID=UPI001EE5F43C|nr:sodium-coupled monocarboxylate transporter 2-like [Haliotis rubra]